MDATEVLEESEDKGHDDPHEKKKLGLKRHFWFSVANVNLSLKIRLPKTKLYSYFGFIHSFAFF